MAICYFKKSSKELIGFRSAFHCEKVDDLDEKFRLASARFASRLDQLFQSGQKSIMPDSEQGPARNIANTGGFDDQRGRSSFRETAIPIEIVLSDEAVFSRPPGDHRRHPGAACECERTDVYRLKEQRFYGLVSRGPARFRNRMLDGVRELPHCVLTLSRCAIRSAPYEA